jgi:O-antigen/teichoic acid export membrane protein
MKKINKKLASNATFLFLDWLFVTLLNFVYWSVAGKTLLPEQYGIVSTSVNLANLLSGLGLLGLNTTLWKLIPEYLEKKQNERAKELIQFSLKTVFMSNIIIILVLLLFSNTVTETLKIPTTVVFITGINLLIVSLWTQSSSILMGIQEMKKIALTDIIGQTVKILSSATLIFLGFKYFGPLIGFMVGVLTVTALRIPFRFLGRIKKEVLDKKQILLMFALPAFISNLSWLVFVNGQYVLLTALKGLEVTGIFTVAFLLTSPIVSVPNVLSSALFPIISQLSINHNSKGKQGYLINTVFRYALLFSIPAAIFLIIFSNHVILLFARAEYLPASSLFPILALASIIYGSGIIFNSSLYSLGRPKLQRNIILMTVILFFILAFPLTFFLSAAGMGLAYLISVFFLCLASYRHINRMLRIKLPFDSVKKILISSFFSFIFLYFLARSAPNILFAIVFCFLAGLIYLEILFLLKFYSKQDIIMLEAIAEKSPLFKKHLLNFVNFLSKFL